MCFPLSLPSYMSLPSSDPSVLLSELFGSLTLETWKERTEQLSGYSVSWGMFSSWRASLRPPHLALRVPRAGAPGIPALFLLGF